MGLEASRTPQQRPPSRIIIADDHPLFRSAIRQTLELCRRLCPELVLMDLRMPEMDGVAATHAIRSEFPDTLVLILTAVDEARGLSNSLEAGAAGYILKHAPPAQITHAVRRVLAGETPLDDEVSMRLITSLLDSGGQEAEKVREQEVEPADYSTSEISLGQSEESNPDRSLTPREVEVLRLVWRDRPTTRSLGTSSSA